MKLTTSQFETLRSQPQYSDLGLAIFQPKIIFQAQINASGTNLRDLREVPYYNVTTGSYTDIENGFTAFIGSTQGGMEIGKIRVRSATSTKITVSENSNINWQSNQWITIYKFVELWPVFPRIIQDPANKENTIWYKDYDILYTNQNSILGTYVNMGPHRAAVRDPASGLAQIYYSSTGSYNLRGDTVSYSWTFEGATTTTSTASDPGFISYNTPGNFVTRLIISGSNGSVDTSYRYVVIDPPEYKWQLSSLSGSVDEGGYTASIRVFSPAPIQQNVVVILYKKSFYGGTQINLGGNFPNAGDIFFVGYIDGDSIEYDFLHSEVSFDAISLTNIMQKASGFSVSVESKANPRFWYHLLDMDGRRALYHYLRWHTTAMMIGDFQFVGDDPPIQFFDSDRGTLYDSINSYMDSALIGRVTADRQGKVWMEVEAQVYTDPTGSFPAVMAITKRDWKEVLQIEERLTPELSYAEYGGVAYSGTSTGTFAAIISAAPGLVPAFYGSAENHEGLALRGQTQLNYLVGNVFANSNSPYPRVSLDMGINAANLDIAPQEGIDLTILRDDTVRDLEIRGLYLADSMSWQYDPQTKMLLPTVELKQVLNGIPGQKVTIPTTIPDGFQLPNFPIPPLNVGGIGNSSSSTEVNTVLVHELNYGLLLTHTFNTDSPVWYPWNTGIPAASYPLINRIVVCPNGAVYVMRAGGGYTPTVDNDVFIYRAASADAPFELVENLSSLRTKLGLGATPVWVGNMAANPLAPETIMYTIWDGSSSYVVVGGGSSFPLTGLSFGTATMEASISFANNRWYISYGGLGASFLKTINAAGTSTISTQSYPTFFTKFGQFRHVRPPGLDIMYFYQNLTDVPPNGTISAVTNNGTVITNNIGDLYKVTEIVNDADAIFAVNQDGSRIMTTHNNTNKGMSSDGGYTLIDIANLPVVGPIWRFTNAGDDLKWIAVSSYLYYTEDFFATAPIDKRGNILTINPLFQLDNVRVLGTS